MSSKSKIKRRRSKYGAVPTVIDGIRFASKKEAKRYTVLKDLENKGEIHALVCHPSFSLAINGQHLCRYIADFKYMDNGGVEHVEDVKGMITSVFTLKKKLMKILLNIEVEIFK